MKPKYHTSGLIMCIGLKVGRLVTSILSIDRSSSRRAQCAPVISSLPLKVHILGYLSPIFRSRPGVRVRGQGARSGTRWKAR